MNTTSEKVHLFRLMGKLNPGFVPWPLNDLQKRTLAQLKVALDKGEIATEHVKVCLCGSKDAIQFAAIDRFGLPFGSFLCMNCGLVFSNPRLAAKSLPDYYDKYYHPLHFGRQPDPNKPLFAPGQGTKVFSLIKDRLDTKKSIKVLEVGAGSGTVLKEFFEAAHAKGIECHAVGLEYDKESVDAFSGSPNIRLIHGGLESVPLDQAPFDIVIMSHVFEHFADPHAELSRLKQVIGQDTLLFIEVPGLLSLKQLYKYDCDYLKYFTSAHIFNYDLTSLTNILNMNGFKLVWGNEAVESIFALGNQALDLSDNARLTLAYIEDLEINLSLYQSLAVSINMQENAKLALDIHKVAAFVNRLETCLPLRLRRRLKNLRTK